MVKLLKKTNTSRVETILYRFIMCTLYPNKTNGRKEFERSGIKKILIFVGASVMDLFKLPENSYAMAHSKPY